MELSFDLTIADILMIKNGLLMQINESNKLLKKLRKEGADKWRIEFEYERENKLQDLYNNFASAACKISATKSI